MSPRWRPGAFFLSPKPFFDFCRVGFSKVSGLSSDPVTRSVRSTLRAIGSMSPPDYSLARLRPRRAGLRFIRRPQITNGPIQQRSHLGSDTTFLLLPDIGQRSKTRVRSQEASQQRRIAELERLVGQKELEIRFLDKALRRVEELRQPKNGDGGAASSKR